MNYCKKCGKKLEQAPRQCPFCGAQLQPKLRPCRKCQAETGGADFCPECGAFQKGGLSKLLVDSSYPEKPYTYLIGLGVGLGAQIFLPLFLVVSFLICVVIAHPEIIDTGWLNFLQESEAGIFLTLTADVIAKVLPLVFLGYLFRKSLLFDLRRWRKNAGKYALIILVFAVIGFVATLTVSTLFRVLGVRQDSANQASIVRMLQNKALMPIMGVSVILMAPLFEELIYRFVVVNVVERVFRWPRLVAFFIAGSLFALIHVISELTTGQNLIQILPYLVLSYVITGAYYFSGKNLTIPIILHALNNVINFVLIVSTL